MVVVVLLAVIIVRRWFVSEPCCCRSAMISPLPLGCVAEYVCSGSTGWAVDERQKIVIRIR